MTYALSHALQEALFAQLSATLDAPVYDALPQGTPPPLYVALGAEEVRDLSDSTGRAAQHDVLITVASQAAGFAEAKSVAAAVSDALSDPLPLSRGLMTGIGFLKARAKRTRSGTRLIEMTFRARLSDAA